MSPYNKQGRRKTGAALMTLMLAVSPALAGPSGAGVAGDPAPTAVATPRRVTLDFVQTDVNVVAKALSIQSKTNVVLMPSVKGQVTVRLVDLTVDEALDKAAAAVGAEVKRIDGTYFLGTKEELRGMIARSGVKETLELKYMDSKDAKSLIQAAYPFVTAEEAGKANLVLSGMVEDVQAGLQLVRAKDIALTPPPAPKPEPPKRVKDTYTVKFAKTTTLAETLEKAITGLKVDAVEQTLILEGTDDNQKAAEKLIAALDIKGAGERVVRLYKLKYLHPHQASATLIKLFPDLLIQAGFESYSPAPASFKPLGLDTANAFNQTGLQGGRSTAAAGSGGVDLDAPGNRSRDLILAGSREQVEQASQVLTQADISPRQVVIEARMVETSPELLRNLGLEYDWSPLNFTELLGAAAGHTFAGSFGRTPFNFSANLNANESKTTFNVLAKPNVAVVDGEEASIFIGDIYRYERLSAVTATGETYTIEEVPIGVALLCRPRITEDGRVVMRVHPVVSTIRDFTGRNKDIPVTSSREADSTIMMKSGETFAFGGLIRDEDLKTITKVPILGDLPILGQLFRNQNRKKSRTEVTVFITAKIVDPDQALPGSAIKK